MTEPQPPRLPDEPTPVEPTPVEPTPVEPTPVEPVPHEPVPDDPAPAEVPPVDPAPAEVPPVDPAPAEVPPVDPAPAEVPPIEPTPAPDEQPLPVDPPTAPTYEPPPLEQPAPPAPPVHEPPPVEVPAPQDEALDSVVAEPAAQVAVDPTPEVPTTLADEPPAAPAAAPAVPEDHPLPPASPSPDAPETYGNAGQAPGEQPAEAAPKAPRSRAWVPATALGLAVVLLAGATGFLAWQLWQQKQAEDGRPDAIAAARDAARLLFSYDHESLAADFEKGLAVTTGGFRDEYSRTTKEVVTPVAQQYKAVVVAEVIEAAVVDADAGEVTAIVFLNQGTTSTRVEGQQVDQSRVRMHLVERDGEWLVEAVEAL